MSSVVLPLFIGDKVIAAIKIYSISANAFNDNEVHLLRESAGDLSLGIEKIRRGEEALEMEEALKASEQNFRNSMDNSPMGIRIVDTEGHILYANQAFLDIFGYKNIDEIRTIALKERFTLEGLTDYLLQQERALCGDPIPDKVEIDIIRKDGAIRHLQVFHKEVLWDGKMQYQTLYNDITERKQAEEALRQSEEKYRQLVNNMREGIWVIDKDSCTTFVNPSMTKMLGYKNDEMLGKPLFSFIYERGMKFAIQFLARRKEGVKEVHDFEFMRKDGERVYFSLETSPITDKDGNYIGAIVGVQDITGRIKMQEQLIMQDRLASIGQMASGIAHELNNPLTSVIGFSELLLGKDLAADVREDLTTINREAKRTANVVRGLLAFARKQGTEKALVDINSSVQGVLQLRSYEQRVNNIKVNVRFAFDLPQILGNGDQLQQVFLNIIANAEQAMLEAHHGGSLTIVTERVGDIVKASIGDDGPGISEENMKKLFTPFFTTKVVGKGTGLGLSICHGIVSEHGGKIYAVSEVGKGATFVVEFPIS
jgi:PAS domain S-box/PAS domain S-box